MLDQQICVRYSLFCVTPTQRKRMRPDAQVVTRPLSSSTLSACAIARLAAKIGSPAAAILFRALGSAALLVVILSEHVAVVVAALLVRGAFMNAIDGLTSSLLNEHVSRKYAPLTTPRLLSAH